ncbi:MAG: RNA polymerase sigma factor SigJ [Lapillicoccus sp.]
MTSEGERQEGPGDELAREFDGLRTLLVGAAYRVVGSVADAEDAVQEAWLRWAAVDRAEVRDVRAYLLTITTRQALNRLRRQRSRREDYVGPWLPEPIATTPDPADEVELADSISMAMLVVLESLSPLERVAFVLHDVFGLSFSEVAVALDRTEPAVRQLASRARGHVHARRPETVGRRQHDDVVRGCLAALAQGDIEGFVSLLAPDVVLISDGGGLRRAALKPIHGVDKVVRWCVGVMSRPDTEAPLTVGLDHLNGETAIVLYAGGPPDTVVFLTIEPRGVTAVHIVRNPEKLSRLTHLPAVRHPG